MKPHEETWDNSRDFEVTVCGPELDRDIDAPREVLARAAPEMARAIMKILADDADGYVVSVDHLNEAREALRKSGIL